MLWILISGKSGHDRFLHPGGPLEFGRGPRRDVPRKVLDDPTISTNQLLIESQDGENLRLCNLSTKVTIRFADGTLIHPGGEKTTPLPVRLHAGDTLFEIEAASRDQNAAEKAALRSIEPPLSSIMRGRTLAPQLSDAPAPHELARWFESLVAVQRAAASSPDFFAQTARAIVELIGLDSGSVLLRQEGRWVSQACYPPRADSAEPFSHSILDTVARERRTFFQVGQLQSVAASLQGVVAVVASPILNESQEVIGAVYGARRGAGPSPEIDPLEAQLTQVLAAAVAAGLARVESEAQAARRRVQFENFFTPDLAAALDRDPSLLNGSERDVTILFADIRGFSAVSEHMPARLTCELVRDVMELLTAKIMESAGVVVDYIGDGLMAMWNAPVEQDDHAARACRAALAMGAGLPELTARWQNRLGSTLKLGIGINSGPALVGNTGSFKKFKYGPLGHTVNLASRVEGATKHLGVGLLMTGSTHKLVGESFATRRLCRAHVVGIEGGVDLYELYGETAPQDWLTRRSSYERALALYEAGHWSEACQILIPFLSASGGTYDLPSLTLLSRAVDCLESQPAQFDPIVQLKSK
jgi:adenylate cyclase